MNTESPHPPRPAGKHPWRLSAVITAALLLATPFQAFSSVATISPQELQERREAREIALIIDLRTHAEFERGHIPGAINIPYFAIETKSVPPFGAVAVYGDGLGRIDDQAAAAALQQKPGIKPLLLAGGLAAWESAGLPTTHAKGLTEAHVPFITYEQLASIQSQGVVLADLRTPGAASLSAGRGPSSAPSDLRALFPGARVVEAGLPAKAQGDRETAAAASVRAAVLRDLAGVKAGQELVVLVDDGDGSAERALLELRSAGNKRVVVLAGGESILAREGRPGLQRVGYSFSEAEAESPAPSK